VQRERGQKRTKGRELEGKKRIDGKIRRERESKEKRIGGWIDNKKFENKNRWTSYMHFFNNYRLLIGLTEFSRHISIVSH
jgi:hypothetical protein